MPLSGDLQTIVNSIVIGFLILQIISTRIFPVNPHSGGLGLLALYVAGHFTAALAAGRVAEAFTIIGLFVVLVLLQPKSFRVERVE